MSSISSERMEQGRSAVPAGGKASATTCRLSFAKSARHAFAGASEFFEWVVSSMPDFSARAAAPPEASAHGLGARPKSAVPTVQSSERASTQPSQGGPANIAHVHAVGSKAFVPTLAS